MDALRVNKLRSFLASLGVVIGISFVIIMGWAISGLDNALLDTFNMIGTDILYVDKWDWTGGKRWKEIRQRKSFTMQQANELCNRIKGAELTFINAREWRSSISYKSDEYSGTSIYGTTFELSLTPSGEIETGRYFSRFEDQIGANVIVLGHKVAETIFPNGDAVGKIVKIKGHKFKVIGTLTKQGTMLMDFIDNRSFMPLKTFLETFGSFGRSVMVGVKAGSEENLDNVREETRGLMRNIRNIRPGEEDDFSINESQTFKKNFEKLRIGVWSVGIGLSVLSFIVGIIGIMNIMFVSVTERTKEIGIRKAIGAKKRSIWTQFIVESTVLCILGAFIAFVLCSAVVFLVATYLTDYYPALSFLSPIIPFDLLYYATIVSLFVGILAGLLPAVRAASLDPVDALRYD